MRKLQHQADQSCNFISQSVSQSVTDLLTHSINDRLLHLQGWPFPVQPKIWKVRKDRNKNCENQRNKQEKKDSEKERHEGNKETNKRPFLFVLFILFLLPCVLQNRRWRERKNKPDSSRRLSILVRTIDPPKVKSQALVSHCPQVVHGDHSEQQAGGFY